MRKRERKREKETDLYPRNTPGNAPVPQDVSNPSQYQTGQQPLNGASYSQSAPSGPPSSMSAYHNPSQRLLPPDERTNTPQLPAVSIAIDQKKARVY